MKVPLKTEHSNRQVNGQLEELEDQERKSWLVIDIQMRGLGNSNELLYQCLKL
jgi:hypothetical protein